MSSSDKINRNVDIPDGVQIGIDGGVVTVTGPKGSLSREMSYPGVKVASKNGGVVVSSSISRRSIKAVVGTFAAHIKNMITGVTTGFEYNLKVVFSHFPITVKQTGAIVTIDNFLGERTPRKSKVLGDSKVSIKGDKVSVTGTNLEAVSQTAANIELATKVKGRDRRVFQDGIYLISKGEAA